MRTNEDSLVKAVVVGEISDSSIALNPAMVGSEGKIVIFFGTGGVSRNVKIGDPAFGWAADHIEPGVSLIHSDAGKSRALNVLSCIGNKAVIVRATMNDVFQIVGKEGFVTGKHGGAERVLVWFDKETVEALTPDDLIRIETIGLNLQLLDYPEIYVRNLSPELLKKLPIEDHGNRLDVGVTTVLPGTLMGSGIGTGNTFRGDVDIQDTDEEMRKRYNLDAVRLGDIVGIEGYDATWGASMRSGSLTVGLVIHGASALSGHGPGVIPLLTTRDSSLIKLHKESVNLADLYGV
ncbi:MAG: DUF4438 domain-containing protein [Dysgonamonadaceae bacterium]|nr:DUF4438 domain-containing protein [Sphaerochaetaceae bacterium]MDD4842314.1 DUF4438 domain-containing protein [Sphaerochaetaceae bacterium]